MEKGRVRSTGESKRDRGRDRVSAPMWTLIGWTRAQYEAQSACTTKIDVLRITQRCAHMHTHSHKTTTLKSHAHMATLRRSLLCVCPAGRETGRHRTHHYYQNTMLHNQRGGGGGGKAICLRQTRTHTHLSVRIKWLREHKQLNIQCRISRLYVNWILSVLMKD